APRARTLASVTGACAIVTVVAFVWQRVPRDAVGGLSVYTGSVFRLSLPERHLHTRRSTIRSTLHRHSTPPFDVQSRRRWPGTPTCLSRGFRPVLRAAVSGH